jgi:hypothetical protein
MPNVAYHVDLSGAALTSYPLESTNDEAAKQEAEQ